MTRFDELANTDAFIAWLDERNPGEEEFRQAVRGLVENVIDLARDTPEFAENQVLQRLTEPDRMISFRIVWDDDAGNACITRGYRVQHTNAIGPYKGGLRFDESVTPSVLKFLAFEQTFKNSLTGLNLGAGKGGAVINPHNMSDREMMRFCYAFMTELYRHIGPETDVPAGDIGVGGREIGYLFGQYKRLENQFAGALTGKPPMFGGSELREEATGYGAVYFLCAMLNEANDSIDGKRITISGAGNVAMHVAEKVAEFGAKPISLSNRAGCLCKPDGLSGADVAHAKEAYPAAGDLAAIADKLGADWVPDGKPWSLECDIAIPSATQNELDEDDAARLVEHGCKFVVEAANMPLTDGARQRFKDTGLLIAPGKAANAGGVAVSGFEMVQNNLGRSWSRDRLDQELRDVMLRIFAQIRNETEDQDTIDYCRGADRAGFKRVAQALVSYGRF